MVESKRIACCRVCQQSHLEPILDYGQTALANRFLREEQLETAGTTEPAVPLRLVLCTDCGLVQIDETVPPNELFQNYVYVTGTSDQAVRHANQLAKNIVERYQLGPNDLVLEAASNDGTVLKAFSRCGVRTLGVEPATNIAVRAYEDGIDSVSVFFGEHAAEYIRNRSGPAAVFLARHVLAHVPDLHGFLRGARACLAEDGVAMVECPYLLPFYQNLEFDTVYHEHLCYFSVSVLKTLGQMCGLELIDVEDVDLHGGSILSTFQPIGGPRFATPAVEEMLEREAEAGLNRREPWAAFARQAMTAKLQLVAELRRLQAMGKRVVGYGAAAKGMSLLSFMGIGPDLLPYIVDKNPYKQGLYTPGHHIPVYGTEKLLEDQPDVVLILAWNFAKEIVAQQSEYAAAGGRFLLPLPEPRYVMPAVPVPARRAVAA
ncbi:MAG: class I SAM-dependent methyltransferase [Gemmataceae bacterium]